MDKGWSGDILRQVWGRVGGFEWRHLEARPPLKPSNPSPDLPQDVSTPTLIHSSLASRCLHSNPPTLPQTCLKMSPLQPLSTPALPQNVSTQTLQPFPSPASRCIHSNPYPLQPCLNMPPFQSFNPSHKSPVQPYNPSPALPQHASIPIIQPFPQISSPIL